MILLDMLFDDSIIILFLIICYAAWDLGWICVVWMKHVMFIWHVGIWAVFLMYWLLLMYNSFYQIRYSGCAGASFNISRCCVTSWCFLLFNAPWLWQWSNPNVKRGKMFFLARSFTNNWLEEILHNDCIKSLYFLYYLHNGLLFHLN